MKILDHLDKLRIFLLVAERGSISAAAKELALTQPAITRAVQTLEDAAGYALFTRNRKGMQLTDGGRILFQTGGRIVKEITDAALRGAQAGNEMAGHFTIGTYESLAEYLWPDFLVKAQETFPLINLSLKTNSKHGHLEELNSGTLDLLVDAEPRAHKGLTLWPLYADRFSFYAKRTPELTPDDASEMTLLYVREVFDENNISLDQHLKAASYRFRREYAFDSFTTVKRMAEKGLGVAILPQRLAAKDSKLTIVRAQGFKESFGPHRIFASVSPYRDNDRRIKALVALLRKQLQS